MRVANWPAKLAETLGHWRSCSFQWGRSDCCQFVGAVVLAITGEDRREIFGRYDSEIGAGRLLVEHGGIQGLLTHAFGEPKPIAFARRGDIVLCEFGNGLQPAVADGAYCWAPALGGGLARRRIMGDSNYPDALMAWSIG